jgi:hypothetical protein
VQFLRSFRFDAVSVRPPFWTPLAMTCAAGGAGAPTPEMSQVQSMPHSAAVLAIGQPSEPPAGPPGALRLPARDDRWKGGARPSPPFFQALIWTTGHSENQRREVQPLVATAEPKRLLLWRHMRFVAWTAAERDADWTRFAIAYDTVFATSLPAKLGAARRLRRRLDADPDPRLHRAGVARRAHAPARLLDARSEVLPEAADASTASRGERRIGLCGYFARR